MAALISFMIPTYKRMTLFLCPVRFRPAQTPRSLQLVAADHASPDEKTQVSVALRAETEALVRDYKGPRHSKIWAEAS